MELFDNQGRRLRRTVGFDSALVVDTDDLCTELTYHVIGSDLSYSEASEQTMDKIIKEVDKHNE